MDRGYQCNEKFDLWQKENKLFMFRIKDSTKKNYYTGQYIRACSVKCEAHFSGAVKIIAFT
jgi:hypothetical protein